MREATVGKSVTFFDENRVSRRAVITRVHGPTLVDLVAVMDDGVSERTSIQHLSELAPPKTEEELQASHAARKLAQKEGHDPDAGREAKSVYWIF